MSEENKNNPAPVAPVKAGARRYTYDGNPPKNAKKSLMVGHEKIKPWEMTDEQIAAFIARHPGQAGLWKDADKK